MVWTYALLLFLYVVIILHYIHLAVTFVQSDNKCIENNKRKQNSPNVYSCWLVIAFYNLMCL